MQVNARGCLGEWACVGGRVADFVVWLQGGAYPLALHFLLSDVVNLPMAPTHHLLTLLPQLSPPSHSTIRTLNHSYTLPTIPPICCAGRDCPADTGRCEEHHPSYCINQCHRVGCLRSGDSKTGHQLQSGSQQLHDVSAWVRGWLRVCVLV